jgi:serine/threonine protein kinase
VCILLELCEFGSLSDLIRGYGFEWNVQALPPLTISWLDRLYFALGCARGLAAVHSIDRHICHRDVKSFNFLVNSHFVVKIADLELGVLRSREPLKVIPPAHSLAAPAYAALPVSPSSHLSSSSSSNPTELVGAVSDRTLVDVENLLPNWLAPEVRANPNHLNPNPNPLSSGDHQQAIPPGLRHLRPGYGLLGNLLGAAALRARDAARGHSPEDRGRREAAAARRHRGDAGGQADPDLLALRP